MPRSSTATLGDGLDRRSFLQGSFRGSIAAAAAAALPGGAFAAGSDRIRIGLVGCGSRGIGAALQAIRADRGVVIAAMADRFPDALDEAGATLAAACGPSFVRASRIHGETAGAAVIAADIDAVILATPPCFRPGEIALAVARGRHVYAEPAIGVDAAGVAAAANAVAAGLRRGLSLASGLQSRHHEPTQRAVAAIAAGSIGRPRHVTSIHHLGLPWTRSPRSDWSPDEARLRNWITDEQLSGGPLLSDHLHAIDRALWAIGEPTPIEATARPLAAPLPSPTDRGPEWTVRITCSGGSILDIGIVRRAGIAPCLIEVVKGDAGSADLRQIEPARPGVPAWSADAGGHAAGMASFIASLRGGPRRDDLLAACRSTMVGVMARSAIRHGRAVRWDALWHAAPPAAFA